MEAAAEHSKSLKKHTSQVLELVLLIVMVYFEFLKLV